MLYGTVIWLYCSVLNSDLLLIILVQHVMPMYCTLCH